MRFTKRVLPQVNEAGFSVIEVLLAAAVFAVLATGLIGAFVYGQQSTVNTGDHSRAMALADEGLQAVRNIRNAGYANLTAGTYGLAQNAGTWTLSGASDTSDIYTRRITLAANGSNRWTVTSTVSWTSPTGGTTQVSDTTQLTNWAAVVATKTWTTPALTGSITSTAVKVATQGNYAYVVRSATSSNFSVVNTTTPSVPTISSTISLTGTPTNIAVSGNYAYVSTNNASGELVVVNITNPAAPTVAATFNPSGSASGLGVAVSGNYVYLSRASNLGVDELVIVNVTTPTAPTRVWGFGLSAAINDVYVDNTTIYLATASSTKDLIRLTPVTFGSSYTETDLNLPGTASSKIDGNGSTIYVSQTTTLYAVNGSTMATSGSVVLPGTINDVDSGGNNYVYAGTSATTGELQVVNVATPTAPTIAGSYNMSGTTSTINGVSYNSTSDIVVGVGVSTTQGIAVFGPT